MGIFTFTTLSPHSRGVMVILLPQIISSRYQMFFKAICVGLLSSEGSEISVSFIVLSRIRMYEKALGQRLKVPNYSPARKECACYLGAYNTCGHLCRYCYANYDATAVKRNMERHDPKSPMLIGRVRAEDKIYDAKQESWIDRQIRMEI